MSRDAIPVVLSFGEWAEVAEALASEIDSDEEWVETFRASARPWEVDEVIAHVAAVRAARAAIDAAIAEWAR